MFNPQLDELDWREVRIGKVTKIVEYPSVKWSKVNMIDLKKGDIFTMIDHTGELVMHENGKTQFMAATDGYVNELGIPAVDIY